MEFIGKLHPLLLHLPIGILVYAFLHWGYEQWLSKKQVQTDFTFAFTFGALAAAASAVSGWVLARGGGYDEDLLQWHKYLGIATAVGAFCLLWAYRKWSGQMRFAVLFVAFILLLGATGHYGGSLTHGADFLNWPTTEKEVLIIENLQEAHIFQDIVMPIFAKKCVSCHNPQKLKGDLLLNDLEGLLKGGKNGPVMRPGLAAESAIISRIFLPKEEEEHMPPTGKLQLSTQERDFLKWWVDNMEHFEQRIKELPTTPAIESYLSSLQNQYPADVDRPSPQQLTGLSEQGILASLQTAVAPWVDVRLIQADSFVAENLRSLKKIAPAIRSIDLSRSTVTDADLKILERLENVAHINLSNCAIGSEAISYLQDLPALRTLNLYGTQVDSSIFPMLTAMKKLEKVYLWQTSITAPQLAELQATNPQLEISTGVDFEQFGSPTLVAPLIIAEQDLFTDSLLITFETQAARAVIKYTLAGSTPTASSTTYTAPFYVYETTEVKGIMIMNGWTDSEAVARTFAKSRFPIAKLKLSVVPNEKYAAEGAETLVDLKKGSNAFADGQWLGFYGEDVVATADLGSVQQVSGVTIGTLSDFNSYIHLPRSISVATSTDGRQYAPFQSKNIPLVQGPTEAQVHNHLLRAHPVEARYIRISFENQKVNPPWHQAPGATCWLFLDEVLVE